MKRLPIILFLCSGLLGCSTSQLQTEAMLRQRCREAGVRDYLVSLPDGTFSANLAGWEIESLDFLRGMPISMLDLWSAQATDLSPLKSLPLRQLNLVHVDVSDLSDLSDLPIEDLDIAWTKVSDLSPLEKMPLRRLNIWMSEVLTKGGGLH